MIYEKEIESVHPLSGEDDIVFKSYEMALKLVSERHEKYDLVDLVHWLIMDKAKTINDELSIE